LPTQFSSFTIRSDMTAPFPPPDQYEPGPDAWEKALLDQQLAELGRLAAMGMDIASDIHRRVTTADAAAPVSELQHAAIDFARVSRAVRLTFALQSKLIADFKARARAAEAANEDESGPVEVHWLRARSPEEQHKQRRLELAVGRAAEAEGRDADAVERLVLETGERLDRDSIWDALQTLPFDAIVTQICADLGLKPAPSSDANRTRPPRSQTSGLDAERPLGTFHHPDDEDRLDRERSP
jgi:hypothetical protein